jgi:hypothetical protein
LHRKLVRFSPYGDQRVRMAQHRLTIRAYVKILQRTYNGHFS